jgi:tetratricopeptide (TPR) repeat protein
VLHFLNPATTGPAWMEGTIFGAASPVATLALSATVVCSVSILVCRQGSLYFGQRLVHHAEAIKVLEKGLEANPYYREFYEAAAGHQMALGQFGAAVKIIRKGLNLFPDDMTLRLLENEAPK